MVVKRLFLAGLLLCACGDGNTLREFDRERADLDNLEHRIEAVTSDNAEEICDIVDDSQGVVAQTFLDHEWFVVPGREPNYEIIGGSEKGIVLSPVYNPGEGFENAEMYCVRHDENRGGSFDYNCLLWDGRTELTPNASFHAQLRDGIFPPRLVTSFSLGEEGFQTELGYKFDREKNQYSDTPSATIRDGTEAGIREADCVDLDRNNFNQRVYSLASFAESMID